MKKLILIWLACLIPIIGMAQKKSKHELKAERIEAICDSLKPYYTETESGIEFSRVIQASNYTSKEELYTKCLELMATAYKDAKEVIQNKDKEQGLIFGKGVFHRNIYNSLVGNTGYKECTHTVKVEVRDGRFKVTISVDGIHINIPYYNQTNPVKSYYPFWKECPIKKVDESFDTIYFIFTDAISILDYFENEISKPGTSNDNW